MWQINGKISLGVPIVSGQVDGGVQVCKAVSGVNATGMGVQKGRQGGEAAFKKLLLCREVPYGCQKKSSIKGKS